MEEEMCSADEVLWCSAAHDEPAVLSSGTSGSPTPSVPAGVPRSPTPYLGGYDDDTSGSFRMVPDDGVPYFLRAPDPVAPPSSRTITTPATEHEAFTEENGELIERVEHVSEALDVIAEGSDLVRGHEIPVVGAVGEVIGMGAGLDHMIHGGGRTLEGHGGDGIPEALHGTGGLVGNAAGLGLRMAGDHNSVVPDAIEDVADTAAAGAVMVDGAAMTLDGDDEHGVPRMGDGAVDGALHLAGLGVFGAEGVELARGPGGVMLGGIASLTREGREINEHAGTFGTAESPDGSERGINSYEFAVANGTDCYTGIHDYLAGDAEEGSMRELAAEAGGMTAGALVGLGAGVVGLGGDLVAGARARSSMFDSAWSWMTD